jgi:lysophospholipase L1-like esterase
MKREAAGRVIRYFDIIVGAITFSMIAAVSSITIQVDREWDGADTFGAILYLLACLLFIDLRRPAARRNSSWLMVSFSGMAAISFFILARQWPALWIGGVIALLLIGLILQFKPIAEPIRRQEVFTLLAIMLSVLSTLAMLEGVLRFVPSLLPEGTRLRIHWRSSEQAWYVPHPYIGHLHITDGSASSRTARPGIEAAGKQDAWGFRNHWPWPAQVDILAVGDSFVYGQMVEDHEAWTALIEQALPGVRVLNLGLIGGAPQQYFRIYETFGLALAPKVLLVGLFLGNDLWDAQKFHDWWKAGGKGAFPEFERDETTGDVLGWVARTVQNLYLFALLKDLRASYQSGRVFSGKTIELAPGERIQLVPSLLSQMAAYARPERPEFTLILETLERVQTLAAQHQTHSVILFFPSKEEVYLPLLGEQAPDLAESFLPKLEERDIAYLNLGPLFRERALARQKLFFEVDGHPNARGYALIAEAVLQYLKAHAQQLGLDLQRKAASQRGSSKMAD